MTTFLADPLLSAATGLLIKATLLLCLSAMLQIALRARASAATRHAIWTLTIAALLALPVMSAVLPAWPVILVTAEGQARLKPGPTTGILVVGPGFSPASRGVSTMLPTEPRPTTGISIPTESQARLKPGPTTGIPIEPSLMTAAAGVYLAGVALMSLLLGLQWRYARRLAHAADTVTDPEWRQLLAQCADAVGLRRAVALRRSRARSLPMVLGVHRPIVIIPAIADAWPADRRQAVIRHELAHVARRDCLTQTLAHAACALYWFHPGVWLAARQMRIERELACDDLVIAAGTEARDYAAHLLEIAYASGPQQALALAVNMAGPRHLEGRLRAALDAARNRRVPGVRVRAAVAAIAVSLLLTVASATSKVVSVDTPPDQSLQADAPPARAQQTGQDPALRLVEARLDRLVRYTLTSLGLQDLLPGTWEIRPTNTEDMVNLRITEGRSSWGSNVPLQDLEGLTAGQLTGPGGPVQFRIRRDAGSLVFEGIVRNGVGAGTFSFDANRAFPGELVKRGFAAPSALEQYQLARGDIGYAFIDELTRQGYGKPDIATLVRAGQHGVSTTYLREMGTLGYRLGTLDPLITLRDHGVTPTYVRGMIELGYKGLPADDLRQARDHGVDPAFVRGLADAGYRNLAIDHAIKVRDHGVTPDYVRAMRDFGFGSLSIDELINARDHGVDIQYVSAMRALGHDDAPLASLIRMRDHGVTPQYIAELKAEGYAGLSADDLVMLRDHGATADRIRAANARARSPLSLMELRALARRGGLQ